MSAIAIALKHLMAAGVTGDALVAAIAEIDEGMSRADPVAEKRRAYDRERKRAAKIVATGIPPETVESAETPKTVSPNDIYSNPHKTHSAKAELPLFEKRVVEVWNEASAKHGLKFATSLEPSRKSKLRARIRDHDEQTVLDAIARLAGSRFHCGDNDRNWSADIGWFLTASNFVKALEMAPPKAGPAKLSGDELAEHRARLAEHYDRTGKTVEAAEIRRASTGPPRSFGNIATNILNRQDHAA